MKPEGGEIVLELRSEREYLLDESSHLYDDRVEKGEEKKKKSGQKLLQLWPKAAPVFFLLPGA